MKCPNCGSEGIEKTELAMMDMCENCGVVIVFTEEEIEVK